MTLQQALRNNQRTKKLPFLKAIVQKQLDLSEQDFSVPTLEESDRQLTLYRSAVTEGVRRSVKLTMCSLDEFTDLVSSIKAKLPDEKIYLYLHPYDETGGSIEVALHKLLTHPERLLSLNEMSFFALSNDASNCLSATYDSEWGSNHGKNYYELEVKGSRFIAAVQ